MFIVAIIVDAIDRMNGGWLEADFGEKFIERLEEKLYPSSAIVLVSSLLRILASGFSRPERCVFWRRFSANHMAVCSSDVTLIGTASATFTSAIPESAGFNESLSAAGTLAIPSRTVAANCAQFDNGPVPKGLAGKIVEAIASFAFNIRFSHVRFLPNRILLGQACRERELSMGRLHFSPLFRS